MFRRAAKETLAFGHVLETFCFRDAFLKRRNDTKKDSNACRQHAHFGVCVW